MREADHPADGRFGNRPVDGAGSDNQEYIGRGAGGHVDVIVADAETSDGQ